jgi:hypothetical protein
MEVTGSSSMRVSWEAVSSVHCITGYAVVVDDGSTSLRYYDFSSGTLAADGEELSPIPADVTSVEITGLCPRVPYSAQVAACNRLGWGRYSALCGPASIAAPVAPGAPRCRPLDSTTMRVSWRPVMHTPPVTGYAVAVHTGILRYFNARSGRLFRDAGAAEATSGGTISVVVRGLSPGIEYKAEVAALNEIGRSKYSPFSAPVTLLPADGGADADAWAWQHLRIDLSPGVPCPRTLLSSRYRAVCDQTPPEGLEHAADMVLRMLSSGADLSHRGLCEGDDIVETALALWIGEDMMEPSPTFVRLNQVLMADEEEELQERIATIRFLEECLLEPRRSPGSIAIIAWRGSKLTRGQVGDLRQGEVIRPPMFVAATTDRNLAEVFQDTYLVRLAVPAGCRNAGLLSRDWASEVVLPPYTPLRITSVKPDEKVLEVDVLDGLHHLHEEEQVTGLYSRAFPI